MDFHFFFNANPKLLFTRKMGRPDIKKENRGINLSRHFLTSSLCDILIEVLFPFPFYDCRRRKYENNNWPL